MIVGVSHLSRRQQHQGRGHRALRLAPVRHLLAPGGHHSPLLPLRPSQGNHDGDVINIMLGEISDDMHGGVPSLSDRDNESLTAGIHHTITVYFQQIPSDVER